MKDNIIMDPVFLDRVDSAPVRTSPKGSRNPSLKRPTLVAHTPYDNLNQPSLPDISLNDDDDQNQRLLQHSVTPVIGQQHPVVSRLQLPLRQEVNFSNQAFAGGWNPYSDQKLEVNQSRMTLQKRLSSLKLGLNSPAKSPNTKMIQDKKEQKMTELEQYRADMRKRLIYGVEIDQLNDQDESIGFQWKKGFAPPSGGSKDSSGPVGFANKKKKRSLLDYIVIKENSKWKATFDIYINLLVAYSCFTTIYFVSFDDTPSRGLDIFNYIVEVSFLSDFIMNFLTEYIDPDTYQPIRSITQIGKQYVFRGWFIIDFVAIIPFQYFMGRGNAQNLQTKLIRLFRLPRMMKLIDITRFNSLLKSLFENNSAQEDRIMLQYFILYCFKIFRLFIIAFIITYFCGCVWYILIDSTQDDEVITFFNYFEFGPLGNMERLVKACYYALTTLSTVGYGDMFPITDSEVILAVVYILAGAAFFAYIMGSFIEIIANYQRKMGRIDRITPLRNWMTLMMRFTGDKPLSKTLNKQIETHFQYFWQHDRLQSIFQHYDRLTDLPKSMRRRLLTSYIFEDVFHKFMHFFKTKERLESKFLYDISFGFMPRQFNPHIDPDDKILYEEESEVPEMYFCLDGKIGVGFSIFARGPEGRQFRISKYFKKTFIICDHYVVNNKRSEFIYMVIKPINCFALTKKFLLRDIFPKYPEIASEMKAEALLRYRKTLKNPITEHMNKEYENLNKKSVTRVYEFRDKKAAVKSGSNSPEGKGFSPARIQAAPGSPQRNTTRQNSPTKKHQHKDSQMSFSSSLMNTGGGTINQEEDVVLTHQEKQARKREREHMHNQQLKSSMDTLKEEMTTFASNQGKLAKMCNREIHELLRSVDQVGESMRRVREKQQIIQTEKRGFDHSPK